jgi:hypothetical protein
MVHFAFRSKMRVMKLDAIAFSLQWVQAWNAHDVYLFNRHDTKSHGVN